MLIPVPSTLAFTPQAYYISLHTLFPIATHLYLLARRATTTAPSVSDVVSKGSHVLCAANRVCMGVASGLQPVTAYDVYYWFVSEAGAAGTLVAEGLADVYVEGLAAETLYQVWCYAETAEGLPMQNTLQSLHVAQRTFPCGLW